MNICYVQESIWKDTFVKMLTGFVMFMYKFMWHDGLNRVAFMISEELINIVVEVVRVI